MVEYPLVRLEADGVETLLLTRDNGWVISALDLGAPVVRESVQAAPDADGTQDRTKWIGARTVTLAIAADPSAGGLSLWTMRQRLAAFTSPRLRPTMFFQFDATAPEQRLTLRRSDVQDVIDQLEVAALTVQWVAPAGVLESSALHTTVAMASGVGLVAGRSYPRSYPRTYPSSAVVGSTTVTNEGTAHAYPVLRVYGPCTDPTIENITADLTLAFADLEVFAGDFLEIDTRARTIRYNADPSDSRYPNLSFPTSRWWTLAPGDNIVRFVPDTSSEPSQVHVVYRDTWL